MSLRDRIRDAVVTQTTDPDGSPALARRATQVCALAADTLADHTTAGAAAASVIGAAAVAAEGALAAFVYPPGEYATFREDPQ
ncbi:MAG TPA: hypothetical protein VFQ05_06565 [Candidatus Eisenbacteria bacterium]|nr:hypothetical protein [Candidatus Eisenbacteria bacterium]